MGITVKMSFEEENQQEMVIILKNENGPRATSVPALGLKYHNIQTCLLVYAADLRTIGPLVLFLLQNIDCGYSLEPPRRGGSNVYPQSMF